MPKKRGYNFKSLQGSSSTSNNTSDRDGGDTARPSVNERLNELRRLEDSAAAMRKRELADNVNQRSVPPELRAILGVPESVPPKPKHGTRPRRGVIAIPGPAPPRSWIKGGLLPALRLRGKNHRLTKDTRNIHSATELFRFARMTDLKVEDSQGSVPSLLHMCLKVTAQQWQFFDEADLPALAELPLQLRLLILHFLAVFGPSINIATFDALTTGGRVEVLDLGSLIGHGDFSLSRLTKLLKTEEHVAHPTQDLAELPETWDAQETALTSLTPSLSLSRLASLTHLSLSHPPQKILWRDLLSFAKHIPNVTHLSLAYWPRPTLTPNLITTTVDSPDRRELRAGGSAYYSGLDKDFSEPVSLLRQLSHALLYLQWLDLEGCTEWTPALAETTKSDVAVGETGNEDQWSTTSSANSFLLNNWKNLSYVNVDQGWRPDFSSMQSLDRTGSDSAMYRLVIGNYTSSNRLRKSASDADTAHHPEKTKDEYSVEKRRAHIWTSHEADLLSAGIRVNLMRTKYGCALVTFDHGWTQCRVSMNRSV